MSKKYSPLQNYVIDYFGGVQAFADEMDVTRQTIHRWCTKGLPMLRAIQIQHLSGNTMHADFLHDCWFDQGEPLS